MKARSVAFLGILCVGAIAAAQTPIDARQTILGAYRRMARQEDRSNTAELRRFIATDCMVVSMGVPYRFWDAYKPIVEEKNGPHGFAERIFVDSLEIRGDKAVARVSRTGGYWAPKLGKMRHFTGRAKSVEIWRRRNGKWQIVEIRTTGMAMHKDRHPGS